MLIEQIIIVSAVGVVAAFFYYGRRQISTRIARLNHELGHITRNTLFEERVTESRDDDELGRLTKTVNRLFSALEREEKKATEREALFKDLAEGVQESIIVHRERIIYANPRAASMRGLRQQDLANIPVLDLIHADSREQVQKLLRKQLAGNPVPDRYEAKLRSRDGEGLWVEVSSVVIEYQGQPAVLTASFDISKRKAAEAALRREKERAQTTLQSIAEGVITTNVDGLIDYVNGAAEAILGVDIEQAVGQRLLDLVKLVDERDRKPLADPVARCLAEVKRVNLGRRALLLADDGSKEYSIEMTVSPIQEPKVGVLGAALVLRDVTELRGLAAKMSYQATHDPLTGLANRREFEHQLEEALQSAQERGEAHVVSYLDLDRFKYVNDSCGHSAGDGLLREVATLIKDQVRDSDLVARIGGDEFGILLMGCPLDKARQIADDVCKAVADYRFVWRDQIFAIGVSIGLVEINNESGGVDDVVSAADSACYVAKQQGRGQVHVYSAKDEALARHRGEIVWLKRLQQALKENQFELYCQPIKRVSHRAHGPSTEVLLRIEDAQGHKQSPAAFLDAAERYRLMPKIDRWVVQSAFAAIANGSIRIEAGDSCAINLSGQTVADSEFLEFVVETLDATGVSADQICFEVGETAVVTNLSQSQRFVEVLHGLGCSFGLDDFGSGLGSMANLKNMSLDYLKLDGSYTKNLDKDTVNQAMVSAIVGLARTLDIQVIAEQVEHASMLDMIEELGIDRVQGYAVAHPAPIRRQ